MPQDTKIQELGVTNQLIIYLKCQMSAIYNKLTYFSFDIILAMES